MQRSFNTGTKCREDSIIEDGLDKDDGILEPDANLDDKNVKQQVYAEMKSNCINVEHLIHLLRYDRKNNQHDHSPLSTQRLKGLARSSTSQSVDKLGSLYKDDIVSRYTLQSIDTCQDPKFLFLLLKNFARGKHSAIIEETVSKIDEEL